MEIKEIPNDNKKKLLGIFRCDTIFSGDWSREGKIHTIENLCRVIGGLSLYFAGVKDIWWLGVIGVVLIGVVLRPGPNYVDVSIW